MKAFKKGINSLFPVLDPLDKSLITDMPQLLDISTQTKVRK